MVTSRSPSSHRTMAMSPPPLTPEVGPSCGMMNPTPLRIDIPDHFHHHHSSPHSSSSFTGSGYSRRLIIRTPPAARAGLVTTVLEAVLSKEDAEHAATAVTLTPPPPSPPLPPPSQPQLTVYEHAYIVKILDFGFRLFFQKFRRFKDDTT